MRETKHTVGDILNWLQKLGMERPADQEIIMDVVGIIDHHIKLLNQLKKISPKGPVGPRTETIETVQSVLYDSN